MTIWAAIYIAHLSFAGMVAFRLGDVVDARGWVAIMLTWAGSWIAVQNTPHTALVSHALIYLLASAASYWVTERWYGEVVGFAFAALGFLAFLALGGFIPYEYGKGFSYNFWNMNAIIHHIALLALWVGIWKRANVLFG